MEPDGPEMDRLVDVIAGELLAAGIRRLTRGQESIAALIDHTLLKPDATAGDLDLLCDEAARYGFATVCVNPVWVARCARRLRGTAVAVCSVVGFPFGATTSDAKAFETRRALFDGAREIDTVMNIGALRSGDVVLVQQDIEAVTRVCRDGGALSKVIIEAAFLSDEQKVTACALVKAACADFVKTSTGFGPAGATVHDVALMRRAVGAEIGVKASGGIRDLEALYAMVAAGASRIGTSSGVKIVQEAARAAEPATAPAMPSGSSWT